MYSKSRHPVAILLATYNGEKYLPAFLDSLCAQSYKNFLVYVRDDGSTDDTLKILAEYGKTLDICILPSRERLGPAKSFFRILEEASDEHSCYLLADQDDYWSTEKVQRAADALHNCLNEVVLYCTRLEYVDERLRHIRCSRVPRVISLKNAVVENIATGCTIAITQRTRRGVLAPTPYGVIMHDWWLYIYCTAFGRVIYDPRPSIKYRQHGNNTIGVATNYFEDFRRRWIRFTRREGGVHRLSDQAKAFLACYGNLLDSAQRKLFDQLIAGLASPVARFCLALHPPVLRQSRADTFVLRLLFLIGRY